MKKNKTAKKETNKPTKKEKKEKKFSFQKMMMWFLAVVLIVSMVLPALVGFI